MVSLGKKKNIQESERREGKEPFSVCKGFGGRELRSAGRSQCDRWMSSDLRWRDHEPEERTCGSSDALYRSRFKTAGLTTTKPFFGNVFKNVSVKIS